MRYTSTGFPQKLLVGVNNSHVTVPSTLNSIYRYNDVLIFIKRAVTGNLFQAPCKFCSVNMRNRKLVMRREADEDEVGGIGKPQKFIDLLGASQDEGKQANS